MPLSAERIMGIAKIIDRSVIRWLTTTDVMEKEDLVKRCRTLLDEVNQHLYTDVKLNVEQQAAVDVFLKAERYFKVTCEKTK
jgi:DNA polymerase elongation subunit (family B)